MKFVVLQLVSCHDSTPLVLLQPFGCHDSDTVGGSAVQAGKQEKEMHNRRVFFGFNPLY